MPPVAAKAKLQERIVKALIPEGTGNLFEFQLPEYGQGPYTVAEVARMVYGKVTETRKNSIRQCLKGMDHPRLRYVKVGGQWTLTVLPVQDAPTPALGLGDRLGSALGSFKPEWCTAEELKALADYFAREYERRRLEEAVVEQAQLVQEAYRRGNVVNYEELMRAPWGHDMRLKIDK